jgi:nitrogen-specific signal transduction histidine kinase
VRLTVSDTGIGMDAQTQAHIFEPFFTTKTSGGSSGLGLAQVYDAVSQQQGRIDVTSQVGQGSRFTLHLPAFTNFGDNLKAIPEEGAKVVYITRNKANRVLDHQNVGDVLEKEQV